MNKTTKYLIITGLVIIDIAVMLLLAGCRNKTKCQYHVRVRYIDGGENNLVYRIDSGSSLFVQWDKGTPALRCYNGWRQDYLTFGVTRFNISFIDNCHKDSL